MKFGRRGLLAGAGLGVLGTRISHTQITHAQESMWEADDLFAREGSIEYNGVTLTGSIKCINDAVEIGGSLVADDVKISPTLWASNGKGKRLKSGEFGGEVLALNNEGVAVGHLYNAIGGEWNPAYNSSTKTSPAVWVDGEPADLGDMTGTDGSIVGVNDRGVSIGTYIDSSGISTPFRRELDGVVTPLNDGTNNFIASLINIDGLIGGLVPEFRDINGQNELVLVPALWKDGVVEMIPLPSEAESDVVKAGDTRQYSISGLTDTGAALLTLSLYSDSGNLGEFYWYADGAHTRIFGPDPEMQYLSGPVVSPAGHVLSGAFGSDGTSGSMVMWADYALEAQPVSLTAENLNFTNRRSVAINRSGQVLVQAWNEGEPEHAVVLTPI